MKEHQNTAVPETAGTGIAPSDESVSGTSSYSEKSVTSTTDPGTLAKDQSTSATEGTASSSEKISTTELLEKPTRPLSAYNLFFRDEREKLIAACPAPPPGQKGNNKGKKKHARGIGFSDMAKTISARWKVIPDSTKERYESIAAAGRVVYNKKIEEWRVQRTALGLPTKRKNKKKTDKKAGSKAPTRKEKKQDDVGGMQPASLSNSNLSGMSINAPAHSAPVQPVHAFVDPALQVLECSPTEALAPTDYAASGTMMQGFMGGGYQPCVADGNSMNSMFQTATSAFPNAFSPNGQGMQFDLQGQMGGISNGPFPASMQPQAWQMMQPDPHPQGLDPLPVHGIPDYMAQVGKNTEGAPPNMAAGSFSMQLQCGDHAMEPLPFYEMSRNQGAVVQQQQQVSNNDLSMSSTSALQQLPQTSMMWQGGACTNQMPNQISNQMSNQMFGQSVNGQFPCVGGPVDPFDNSVPF